jgi:hypothetical protein
LLRQHRLSGQLEQLVEGVRPQGSPDKKVRFLRRIPKHTLTSSSEWGLRSTRDDPDSTSWRARCHTPPRRSWSW